MNASIDHELAAIVDAAVRPLWATPRRKKMIREELLAHVWAIFDEELEYRGDERAAIAATRARFGAADDLRHQLQASVSLWGDWFLLFRKEHVMSRWFWLLAAFAVATGPGIILPAAAKYRDEGVFMLLPFVLGGIILLAGLGMLAYGVVQKLTRAS